MKNLNLLLIIIVLISFGCSTKEESEETSTSEKSEELKDTKGSLVGKWENLSLIVRMTDSTLTVPKGKWEEVMGFKPIVTEFNADGTYHSDYKTLQDSTFMSSSGTWSVSGDSLTMEQQGVENTYYYITFGDTVIFRAFLDWDQDGIKQDHYVGQQIKIKD